MPSAPIDENGDGMMFKFDGFMARSTLRALDRSHAMITFGPDGTILSANETFLAMMGYAPSELQGLHHRMLLPVAEQDGPVCQALWDDLMRGTPREGEGLRLAKDGREVWLWSSYNPVRGRRGHIARIVMVAADITEAKRRGLDTEGRLSALDRSQAVITFTPNGIIEDANQNFLDALGYRLDEIRGQHHGLFVDPSERDTAAYGAFWTSLRAGQFQAAEYKRLGKGGREIWIQGTYNPILDAQGRVLRVVKFATDVTPQVLNRLRRAEAGRTIASDLTAIGDAVRDVTERSGQAANAVQRVSGDIQAVAAGAEELAASVAEISQRVSHASTISRGR
ncbi:PAS domain S-box protein [Methylobacterium aquaticum]|nr:PAS domain S-box protein [Methylobacterium aquaticum]